MNCEPASLIDAARCYRCIARGMEPAVQIYLLCAWAATGAGCQISWTPDTETPDWTDGSGPHTTDLATFLATVDYATLIQIEFGNTAVTDVSIQNCPSLRILGVGTAPGSLATLTLINLIGLQRIVGELQGALLSLDVSGCPNLTYLDFNGSALLGSVDAHGLASLATVMLSGCNLGTVNLTGCFAVTNLDVSVNPAVVIIGP